MLPWSAEFAGRMDEHVFSSELLRGNPLGDPHERPLWVYLPPGYDSEPDRHYPSVYVLQGYTGHLAMWRNRTAYRQPFPETADAMFAGEAPPAIIVYVDAWYGGSQFVDSPGTGRYHSYLCDEMCYIPDFRTGVRQLRGYSGDIWNWWRDFSSRTSFTKEEDRTLLMLLGVSACYSAREDGTVELPFDPASGVLRPRSGSAGSAGTRSAWCPGTPRHCARCGPSGSTPAPRTTGSSI